ncbi:DUF3135 domain-containing protein [Vibrio sp. SM6]|uniref:DUF3135 domain-containing protein n=1 Tax=Vibrio agarilyticus TaxID=2726741 RepID=A0A7X8YH97_9VIBR|nr:DUF3135 domain-containing protein [Vibrio agarilyticus]NLS13509.1 DUF3135 domain-containing protein [Vibrio agarilyticus]
MTTSSSPLKVPKFDELMALAKNDPSEFDRLKQSLCDQVISAASGDMQPRLRAQQSHIDRVVARCKNPIHTNVVLMNELQKQVMKFREVLSNPSATVQAEQETLDNVVAFRRNAEAEEDKGTKDEK